MTDPYRADWMDLPVWAPLEKPPTNPADPAWPGHYNDRPTRAEAEYDARGDEQ